MPGVQPQPLPARLFGRGRVGGDGLLGAVGIFARIGFGVELHPVGAARLRPGDHLGHGVHEDRDPDALLVETPRHAGQKLPVGEGVPTGIRGDGVVGVGNEGHLRRNHLQHQVDETRNGVALDVEFRREHPFQIAHIVVADVARIGARMHRDPVGSETFDVRGRTDHVGKVAAARIADHGNLIDVNAQLCHKTRFI